MSVTGVVDVFEAQLWPQLDERGPLGIWGARAALIGDGGDDFVEVSIQVPGEHRAAFVYTCYSANASVATTVLAAVALTSRCRLLTNWPNLDPTPGVQGYATNKGVETISTTQSSVPQSSIRGDLIGPNDRFLLLFDPRQGIKTNMTIVSLEMNVNTLNELYTFEAYGYYWDRSVLNAPGGPRHPGSM